MNIEKSWSDTMRRSAAVGGGVLTVVLAVMFVLEAFGIWRPLGQSLTWGAATVLAAGWTIWFAGSARYRLVLDDTGITRSQGKKVFHVPWGRVTDVVEFPSKHRHLAVLSRESELVRAAGEMSMLRSYRLPRFGVVFQADEQVRAAVVERTGKHPRPVRDVVGL